MVKLGEMVVEKYQGTETRKFGGDVRTEKRTIRYPDKRKEETI
jgi:hypothetical protein